MLIIDSIMIRTIVINNKAFVSLNASFFLISPFLALNTFNPKKIDITKLKSTKENEHQSNLMTVFDKYMKRK